MKKTRVKDIFALYKLTAFYNHNKEALNKVSGADLSEFYRKGSLEIKALLNWELDKVDLFNNLVDWWEIVKRFSKIHNKSVGLVYSFAEAKKYNSFRTYRLLRDVEDCFALVHRQLEK